MPRKKNTKASQKTKTIKAVVSRRKALGKDRAILRTQQTHVRGTTSVKVQERWDKRKGHRVLSYDKPIKGVLSTDLARRFSAKAITRNIKILEDSPKLKKLAIQLVNHRALKIPGTNIQANKRRDLIVLQIINEVGEKKALQLARILEKRAEKTRKDFEKRIRETPDAYADAFAGNLVTYFSTIAYEIESSIKYKNEMVSRIEDVINSRIKDVERLQKMNVKRKEKFLIELRTETKDAIIELAEYKMKHGLSFG